LPASTFVARSPTQRLQDALRSLDSDSLLRQTTQQKNREVAVNLLEEVTTLIERFEAQYDELIAVLTESGYEHSLYGSAYRVTRSRLMQANRNLVNILTCSPKTGPGRMRVSEAPRGQETNREATHG